jgi:DNA-binding NarL/FixJ family response regulator
LAELQADAQERKDNGQAPTTQDNQANIAQQAIDQGVDPAIFGDFSEKDLAAGIQKLVNSQVSTLVQQQLQTALAPIQQQQQFTSKPNLLLGFWRPCFRSKQYPHRRKPNP